MKTITGSWAAAWASAVLLTGVALAPGGAAAEDVAPGTVASAANIDQLMGKTFEGVPIGEAIPERYRWMMKNWGLKMTLAKTRAWPRDPRVDALTKEHAGKVRFNSDTKDIEGYVAGVPFPNIDWQKDEWAGFKAAWNFRYGRSRNDILDVPEFMFVLTDGTRGVEREQLWYVLSHEFVGQRRAGQPTTIGDGKIFNKSIISALAPQDIKGLGVFTIRYTTGQLDDTWAYVRAVRRVRRLSGGAWVDPIGGTDLLNDDYDIINAHPAWYSTFKVLGRTKMFVVADVPNPVWHREGRTPAERYQGMNVLEAPYWNLEHPWQLRDIVVVEAVAPTYHPYSKKVIYQSTDVWSNMFAEMYDRKGDIWKTMLQGHKCWCGDWGKNQDFGGFGISDASRNIIWGVNGVIADYQRVHATTYVADQMYFDTDIGPDDVSLATLETRAR